MRGPVEGEDPIRPATLRLKLLGAVVLLGLLAVPLADKTSPYALVLGIDVLIAVLFATSLHFIMGPGGMHSFGHAAYFGLGAYGAALMVKFLGAPMGIALRRGAGARIRWARSCSAGSPCGCPASTWRC